MLSNLKNRSVQTILLIVLYAIFAPYISIYTHQLLYTISMFIKDVLIWLMPITVAILIASTIDSFERKAPLFILVLLLFEGCSNFLSISYAYGVGMLVSSKLPEFTIVVMQDNFTTLWRIPFAKASWWGANNGSISRACCGVCISFGSVSSS